MPRLELARPSRPRSSPPLHGPSRNNGGVGILLEGGADQCSDACHIQGMSRASARSLHKRLVVFAAPCCAIEPNRNHTSAQVD